MFSSLLGAADIALYNIYESAEAMSLDVAMNTALEENLFSNFPAIFNVEDSYLSLASTNTVDVIFYCLVIKVDLCDGIHCIPRYFEYGAFTGLYQWKNQDADWMYWTFTILCLYRAGH